MEVYGVLWPPEDEHEEGFVDVIRTAKWKDGPTVGHNG